MLETADMLGKENRHLNGSLIRQVPGASVIVTDSFADRAFECQTPPKQLRNNNLIT